MKKIIFSAAILALAAIGAIKATETNDYAFNELQMENIEALAENECWDPHVEIGRLCALYQPGCCDYGNGDDFDGKFVN
ncbi:MAG: hypothetical protein J6Y82_06015 [Bacteroidales bacterium]|nr:hypothetical protein [Bacteroidales bacterium]